MLRVFGEEVPLRAHVEVLAGYSAHGDRTELLHWLNRVRDGGATGGRPDVVPDVYLVHGEPEAQDVGTTVHETDETDEKDETEESE